MGHTSRTIPRAAISRSSPGSSSARIPWRIRSACSASRAPRIDGGPMTSPAWGTEARPASLAARNAGANGSGGYLLSSPPNPIPTIP